MPFGNVEVPLRVLSVAQRKSTPWSRWGDQTAWRALVRREVSVKWFWQREQAGVRPRGRLKYRQHVWQLKNSMWLLFLCMVWYSLILKGPWFQVFLEQSG